MNSSAVAAFADTVATLPVALERCSTDTFGDAIGPLLAGPAVGVPLRYDDVSLNGLPVTLNPTSVELDDAEIGVTPVELAIGDYGSVVIGDRGDGAEPISLFVDTHIAVLRSSDIHETMGDAIETIGEHVREGLTSAVIATGPSATADMGSLVYGAHGPQDVHIILLEDQ